MVSGLFYAHRSQVGLWSLYPNLADMHHFPSSTCQLPLHLLSCCSGMQFVWPLALHLCICDCFSINCDDTYLNKSCSKVGFQLQEINQMKLEMCQYPDWELNIKPLIFGEFQAMVHKDFAGSGPYSTYVLWLFLNSLPHQQIHSPCHQLSQIQTNIVNT